VPGGLRGSSDYRQAAAAVVHGAAGALAPLWLDSAPAAPHRRLKIVADRVTHFFLSPRSLRQIRGLTCTFVT